MKRKSLLRTIASHALGQAQWLLGGKFNKLARKTFVVGGKEYSYFVHRYNSTWAAERAVEIPYARAFLANAPARPILEIGNVMSHYFTNDHTVVDKWEQCSFRPVINQDFLDFDAARRFARIVSISTIEHVGWDEVPRRQESALVAMKKIRHMLEPDGRALVTIPIGYNTFLDGCLLQLLQAGESMTCMKRVTAGNEWVETDSATALECRYNHPYKAANAVAFLTLLSEGRTGAL